MRADQLVLRVEIVFAVMGRLIHGVGPFAVPFPGNPAGKPCVTRLRMANGTVYRA
ncbi:hypothetical protein RsS62_63910 [Rhizobium dioscoreae]|nr:hypothetical protein RsS62_63910 [Rhizobium dioscoreae]GLU84419.1 hypothetical protein Rhsp01_55950 [Rhizobium sp. NBRC 114257]